jgi:predicted RNA-binding protein with PIN domain
MPEPTLYLFDGFNLLHAGEFADPRELTDALASFVALKGARGVLVFDGTGADAQYGSLEVRWVPHADALLERLAAEHRDRERVCVVSSDTTILGTAGQEAARVSSRAFVRELSSAGHAEERRSPLADRLDADTRARLERLRRSRS